MKVFNSGDVYVEECPAMARYDRIKEEIGWLKLIFGVFVAIEVSLAGGWRKITLRSIKSFSLPGCAVQACSVLV